MIVIRNERVESAERNDVRQVVVIRVCQVRCCPGVSQINTCVTSTENWCRIKTMFGWIKLSIGMRCREPDMMRCVAPRDKQKYVQ